MRRWSLALCSLVVGGALGVFAAGSFSYLKGEPPPAGKPVPAAAAPKELTSYRDVVKAVLPAVVSVESRGKADKVKAPKKPGDDDPGDDDALGFGSGFIVDAKGVILTNFHVVEGADEVTVYLTDGRKFRSKDFKTDPKTDLAIVRVESKEPLPFLELGDSDTMEIGDRVLAVGAPFGLTGSVTHGIISAKGRSLHMNKYEDFLQTDAPINPGNSGGPLISLDGKVIGVNSAIKSKSGGFQGVGLAIASNLVRQVKDQLSRDGAVHRGYLGVQIDDLDDQELAARLGVKDGHGVVVTRLFDGAPAAKAGVEEGDVITALGGKPVSDMRSLQNAVATLPLDKPVEVSVVRDGKPKALDVTIKEPPAGYGTERVPQAQLTDVPKSATKIDALGAESVDLTAELAGQLGLKESAKGAVLTKVDRAGAASEAGLRRGVVVTKVDGEAVTSASALKDKLKGASADKGVLLQVQTAAGGVNYVLVKPNVTEKP
jgi:serine protease Do